MSIFGSHLSLTLNSQHQALPLNCAAAATAAHHGGRYRVRAGKFKVIEGKPKIHRIVIIEFPSMKSFESWYDSIEYAPWKKIRHQLSESELFVIEALSEEESEKIASGLNLS